MAEEPSGTMLLNNTVRTFLRVAEQCRLRDDIVERLRRPMERIELTLTPWMSDGRTHFHQAFVVHHSRYLGPAKGGIRIAPSVSLAEITALAMDMSWKTALIGVPFGGGKAGIVADPAALTHEDKESLIRALAREGIRHIGPEVYVPAPDMGSNERDMGHIADCIAFSAGASITRGCYVTGKPAILGGIPGRREATGKGVAMTIRKACEYMRIGLTGARAVLQGFGNVGSVAATELDASGCSVIGVADIHGGVHSEKGLDIKALCRHVEEGGRVPDFPGGQPLDGKAILELACDILVPAAIGNAITDQNAPRVRARLVAEGANGPTTPDADEILEERGVRVIPDILCNAGGVFVSYLEYTQETQREQMSEAVVEKRLEGRMFERFDAVYNMAQAEKKTMRAAALKLALQRISDAILTRGLLP